MVKVETAQIHQYRQQQQERSSKAAKFPEEFTPNSLFSLNCREQQGLQTSTSGANSQNNSIYVFSAPWLEPKKGYILSRRCPVKKIPSFPYGDDNNKSPFQEDVHITIKKFQHLSRLTRVQGFPDENKTTQLSHTNRSRNENHDSCVTWAQLWQK